MKNTFNGYEYTENQNFIAIETVAEDNLYQVLVSYENGIYDIE